MALQKPNYLRGHVWWTNLDPTEGSETRKERPCVIVSSDGAGRLPVKLVVPLTEGNDSFAASLFHIRVDPDNGNCLDKVDAADVMQMRCVSHQRFANFVGKLSAEKMEE